MSDDDAPQELHLVQEPAEGIGLGHGSPAPEQKGMQAGGPLIEGYQPEARPEPPAPPPPLTPGIENVARPTPPPQASDD